jgi:glutaredoxin/glutathione-dependent peroxiredoxin
MTIKIGDRVPSVKLKHVTAEGVSDVDTADLFGGKRVVLFSVPGAFTPTCSKEHLPGYIARADEIKAKGVHDIVCLAVNDAFVMKAWAEAQNVGDKVSLLADGSAVFTKEMGLSQDLGVAGLGVRGKRFSMLVDDGVVKSLEVENAPGVSVSGADACLTKL